MKTIVAVVLVIAMTAVAGTPCFAGHHGGHHSNGHEAIALGVGVIAGALVGSLCTSSTRTVYMMPAAPTRVVVVQPVQTIIVRPAPVVVYWPATVVRPYCGSGGYVAVGY